MAFTNRWVCESEEKFDINMIKQTLEEHFGSKMGKEHELRSIVTLKPEIEDNDRIYLNGSLHYQGEEEITDYEITELKTLKRVPKLVRRTYYVEFWMSSSGVVLFKKSGVSNKFVEEGKNLLSEIIFGTPDKIHKLTYDIEKIESDCLDGKHDGMWTFSFENRQGNITKGTAYGEEVNEDPLYGHFRNASKNFIGIKEEINGKNIVKIAIFKKGTIRILSDLGDSVCIPTIFEIIDQFKEYRTLSK